MKEVFGLPQNSEWLLLSSTFLLPRATAAALCSDAQWTQSHCLVVYAAWVHVHDFADAIPCWMLTRHGFALKLIIYTLHFFLT